MHTEYPHHSLFVTVVSLLGLLLCACELDTGYEETHKNALGDNIENSCLGIAYILEHDPVNDSTITIKCHLSDKGVCHIEDIQIVPETAVPQSPIVYYAYNFNQKACPGGYECKWDMDASAEEGKSVNYCVTACSSNEHLYGAVCEENSLENCGLHGMACSENVPGWVTGACVNGQCVAETCDTSYMLADNKCVPSCNTGTHYDSDTQKCQNDDLANCGQKGYACSEKVSNWAEGTCTSGSCHVTSCKGDYQPLNDVCVPKCDGNQYYDTDSGKCMTSDDVNCGQKGYACSSVTGWASGNCIENKCIPNGCKPGYTLNNNQCISTALTCDMAKQHYYDNDCEDNTLENCGAHGKACSSETIPGWSEGVCNEDAKCVASACSVGYTLIEDGICISTVTTCSSDQHYYDGVCEDNDFKNCGSHGVACSAKTIPGWKSGACTEGKCVADKCSNGYSLNSGVCKSTATTCNEKQHYYNGKCEKNDINNCGGHDIKCDSSTMPGWSSGDCVEAKCRAKKCSVGYTLTDEGLCIATALTCTDQQHYYDGTCEDDSVQNCGHHGNNCSKLAGWIKGVCDYQQCVAKECEAHYTLDSDRCVAVSK